MWQYKLRTFFTVSGVVIGVVAFVVLGSFAERLTAMVQGSEQFLAGHIRVVPQQTDFVRGIILGDTLKHVAAEPGVHQILRRIEIPWGPDSGAILGMNSSIVGIPQGDTALEAVPLHEGRMFFYDEALGAVAGAALAAEYNWNVGSVVEIQGHVLKIVGILQRMMSAPDHMLFVNISDAEQLFFRSFPSLDSILNSFTAPNSNDEDDRGAGVVRGFATSAYIVWDEGEDPERLSQHLQRQYEELTFISPDTSRNIMTRNVVTLRIMVISIGGIALVIGVLSIVNTMTMAVTERGAEIALKKALGATTKRIVWEYVSESAILGLLGGIVGVMCGIGFTLVLNRIGVAQHVLLFSLTGRLLVSTIIMSILIGIVGGLYPAIRAAALDPIDGLRRL